MKKLFIVLGDLYVSSCSCATAVWLQLKLEAFQLAETTYMLPIDYWNKQPAEQKSVIDLIMMISRQSHLISDDDWMRFYKRGVLKMGKRAFGGALKVNKGVLIHDATVPRCHTPFSPSCAKICQSQSFEVVNFQKRVFMLFKKSKVGKRLL